MTSREVLSSVKEPPDDSTRLECAISSLAFIKKKAHDLWSNEHCTNDDLNISYPATGEV